MQATEHDITFFFSVGLCLRFGLRPEPRFTMCTLTKTLCFTEANAKRTIYLKMGAVKKGDFRGKLSLGSTSPLSPTLRSKKKN